MKNIILALLLLMTLFSATEIFAQNIKVSVSEDLSELWLNCNPQYNTPSAGFVWPPAPNGYYECEVEKWFGSVQKMLGGMIKYATFLISLIWVLFIVINGIMYSIGWEDKSWAKDRIVKSVWGLLLLLLSWVILNAIAPWIYSI